MLPQAPGGRSTSWRDTARTSLRAAARQLVAIARWGASTPMDLGLIRHPALVAFGRTTACSPHVVPSIWLIGCPHARLVIYPDAGHGDVFQAHDRFVPDVLRFLR